MYTNRVWFQVAPAELESILLQHPDIDDAAVVGVPNDFAGELPVAFVVRKPGSDVSTKAIVAHVNGKKSTT